MTEGVESTTNHVIREARQLAFDELYRTPRTELSLVMDNSFPEKFVDELSRLEVYNKHLFRPNTYLHKWWARRCGSTFRAILKQFVPNAKRRDYYAPGGLEGKVVLDPMMGGGTTLHEAIRLGASVIGADIDPIPVVQARATLTQAALGDLRAAFDQFFVELHRDLRCYFETECPTCRRTLDFQYILPRPAQILPLVERLCRLTNTICAMRLTVRSAYGRRAGRSPTAKAAPMVHKRPHA